MKVKIIFSKKLDRFGNACGGSVETKPSATLKQIAAIQNYYIKRGYKVKTKLLK